jgi:Domain of unknown function (DUF4365)
MKYPKRSETHQIETASWRLLQELAPAEWIIREVSERDYGIDAYIELATSEGEVTGRLVSVQLKGVEKLTWTATGGTSKEARSPQIKVSTANYWFSLPVPVFLFSADLSARKIHYVSVEEGIRQQYAKLSTQDTITFKLLDELHIGSDAGAAFLDFLIARERAYDQFVFHITNLLSLATSFADFISAHQMRDCFMEVELDAHLQFRAIYEACRMASIYLGSGWKLESLKELYIQDRQQWKDDYALLHEQTLDYILKRLEPVFLGLVRQALNLVTRVQADYWRSRDPVFYRLCSSEDINGSIKRIEQRLDS